MWQTLTLRVKWYWAIVIAALILGGIFNQGCTALKISREDATAIVKEAAGAASKAAVDGAVDRFGAAVEEHVDLNAIEAVVKAALPEPGTNPEGPISAAALAAMYVLNQIRKGKARKKELAQAGG